MKKIITLIAFLTATLHCVAALTWYVTKGGSDSNTGTSESTAFLTIQKAVDSSSAGDLVFVDDGVYDSISTANRDITIRSKNGASKTIIDGKDSSTPFNVGGNFDQIKSVLIGFTLRNGRSPSSSNIGGAAKGGTLKNCILTNSFASANGGGAFFSHLENCLIVACNCRYGYAAAAHSCELRNCTVTKNRLDGSTAGGKCALYQCTVYNSIVYDNPSGGIGTGCSAYNCITTDPLFRDAANGDYRLQQSSSCIDAGNNSYSSTVTDLAGNDRVYNGIIDIGAYEYVLSGISNIVAKQRYPWNGLVDLSFTVTGDASEKYDVSFVAKDVVGGTNLTMATLLDAKGASVSTSGPISPGTYRWVWNAAADLPSGFVCNRVRVTGTVEEHKGLYMVIDLSDGSSASSYPVTYLDAVPSGGWTTDYKTTKLVLRKINKGAYKMQNTSNVTLTKDFYLGVFEVTQKQWMQIMGLTSNPWEMSSYGSGDAYPVHGSPASYDAIRGSSDGAQWPSSDGVDSTSFLGKLRSKTAGVAFDLPTEAQWEYACRAGTTTTYYWGDSLNAAYCWYYDNSPMPATQKISSPVGEKIANGWGLYDMSGNAPELCLDWYGDCSYSIDPTGPSSGTYRVRRGGCWLSGDTAHGYELSELTSSGRSSVPPSGIYSPAWDTVTGFRLCLTIE